jgi:basic membrane protein A
MRKRVFSFSFFVLAILALTSCAESPDCFQEEIFCAALVTDTRGLNDHGLNQDTWAGLQQTHADGVVDQIAYIESVDARDYEKNIAFFTQSGYDAIITSGIGLQNATLHYADLEPATVFIGINQTEDEAKPNFIPVTFPEDQMGFVAGALAASLTQTKIVGAVCETSGIDSMWRYCEGFRAGAKYADESVRVIVVYRENESSSKLFIDSEWGFEHGQDLIRDGADVIFAAGGDTGAGALRAASEANARSIGVERDQRVALGDQGSSVVTSIWGRASFTVQGVMRNIKSGNLTDSEMSPFQHVPFDAVVPNNVIDEMNRLMAGLVNGEIKTNISLKKP